MGSRNRLSRVMEEGDKLEKGRSRDPFFFRLGKMTTQESGFMRIKVLQMG